MKSSLPLNSRPTLVSRTLSSLKDLYYHTDTISEMGMAYADWAQVEKDLGEASDTINEMDDTLADFVASMHDLKRGLSLLISQQDLWPLLHRDTRDAISAGHSTLHLSPVINPEPPQHITIRIPLSIPAEAIQGGGESGR